MASLNTLVAEDSISIPDDWHISPSDEPATLAPDIIYIELLDRVPHIGERKNEDATHNVARLREGSPSAFYERIFGTLVEEQRAHAASSANAHLAGMQKMQELHSDTRDHVTSCHQDGIAFAGAQFRAMQDKMDDLSGRMKAVTDALSERRPAIAPRSLPSAGLHNVRRCSKANPRKRKAPLRAIGAAVPSPSAQPAVRLLQQRLLHRVVQNSNSAMMPVLLQQEPQSPCVDFGLARSTTAAELPITKAKTTTSTAPASAEGPEKRKRGTSPPAKRPCSIRAKERIAEMAQDETDDDDELELCGEEDKEEEEEEEEEKEKEEEEEEKEEEEKEKEESSRARKRKRIERNIVPERAAQTSESYAAWGNGEQRTAADYTLDLIDLEAMRAVAREGGHARRKRDDRLSDDMGAVSFAAQASGSTEIPIEGEVSLFLQNFALEGDNVAGRLWFGLNNVTDVLRRAGVPPSLWTRARNEVLPLLAKRGGALHRRVANVGICGNRRYMVGDVGGALWLWAVSCYIEAYSHNVKCDLPRVVALANRWCEAFGIDPHVVKRMLAETPAQPRKSAKDHFARFVALLRALAR
jgi:hypothetical protein